jgi:hypothetical protein
MENFQGFSTRTITNGLISLDILLNAGPRIVRFSTLGGDNLFADIPTIVKTEYGEYSYRGGHRLWHAPEAMPRTYIPDDHGVSIDELSDGVRLVGSTEPGTGIKKIIEIHIAKDQAAVTLEHTLQNENMWQVELAPWTLTMFQLGGTVILPQPNDKVDESGLLHNRLLALWPYTSINDPRLLLRDDFILIRATHSPLALKIGYFNTRCWLAYSFKGLLFRKSFNVMFGSKYPDGGCNSEIYCNDRFVELESLGPLVLLEPGKSVTFTETWEIYPSADIAFLSDEVRGLLKKE